MISFVVRYIAVAILFLSILYGQNDAPRVFSIDPQVIIKIKNSYKKGDPKENQTINQFLISADKLIQKKIHTIIEKEEIPPSGSKHDYLSMGIYWWPDPQKKDGLPYIRKDGERNPEINKITDDRYKSEMIESVRDLAYAFYFSGEEKYFIKAVDYLHSWFINEKTKMNPNLNYAQFIPGVTEGRAAGIIDIHGLYQLVDAIGILETSDKWNKNDDSALKNWFSEMLNWLLISKNGIAESKAKNNHGSWYDVQIVSISLYLGKTEQAKDFLNRAKEERFSKHLKGDGKQPAELVRTNSWSYSAFNLAALFNLASLGERAGIDLWNYTNSEGGSLRKSLDYLLPSALDAEQWHDQQIKKIDPFSIYPQLLVASKKFDANLYSDWIHKIFGNQVKDKFINLFWN